ncbi:hypothetical protein EES43_17190 [Streptomyces sp. ADI96-02]|uniref:hypothetical protein n=1 Tax=unclassified Streptomyces TaxID=2593676 RepID=UPI000F551973|nr:hypothetical protein [Streptomyces sp. ADI96-02]RPK60335.1 hypothetical protein EES43_17190 [Streptomyces sp. ADI96-02]
MLQCTAFTEVPVMAALVVFTVPDGGSGPAPDATDLDEFVLCELGEHDDGTEHAAQLRAGETQAARDLWMFWNDTGTRRAFRLAELPPCPAVIRSLSVTHGHACMLFDRHPSAHSWDVADPLGDLLAERVRDEVLRRRHGSGDAGGDDAS